MTINRYNQIILFILILLLGCGQKETPKNQEAIEIPERIKELENVTVFSPDTQSADTVELVRERVFESNEEVFINGYIGEMAVDERDRLYITATKPGVVNIYVFDRERNYLTNIGREGRGPGEVESIGSISIENDWVYVFDTRLQKFVIYSLNDYSHLKDAVVKRGQLKNKADKVSQLKGNELVVTGTGKLYLRFSMLPRYEENDVQKIFYHPISEDGAVSADRILELKRYPMYFPNKGSRLFPFPMPFSRSSVVSISENGHFFTAWTEDLLIKEYDEEGNYLQGFYYPIKKSNLSVNALDILDERQKVLNRYELPDSWPALHAMEVDDQNRLWIFTITDSDSTYKGWVLNSNGELQARFDIPGERADRSVMAPFFDPVIKNGYLYRRERDISAGIDRVIKYRIMFK